MAFAYADLPLIVNQTDEVRGSTVQVMWEKVSCPAHATTKYVVYYREVLTTGSGENWSGINVPRGATRYDLQLSCFKEYEIAVSTWNANKALPKKRWRVRTGEGISEYCEQRKPT